ncbi:MAG: hypothetical protein Q9160_001598 [Pyrenula sp. 1 TL-2023]
MRPSTLITLLSAASAAVAQTVYLAGDSTMATGGTGGATQDPFPLLISLIDIYDTGWGYYLSNYLSLPVVNNAVAGRSARSYTREGRFTTIANNLKKGDYVVIEFGHNDGGSLKPTDNGRTDCSPSGTNQAVTCQTTYNGVSETVQTFYTYLVNAAKLFQSKGATVIISTATPNNPWETGTFAYSGNRFVTYDQQAAQAVGAVLVDHGQACANVFKSLGAGATDAFFPNDHTHTSPAGAQTVAKAFVTSLQGTSSNLKNYVKNVAKTLAKEKKKKKEEEHLRLVPLITSPPRILPVLYANISILAHSFHYKFYFYLNILLGNPLGGLKLSNSFDM